jgi:hypothetical protein
VLRFKDFLSEGKGSDLNTIYGDAYETGTALHIHHSTGSAHNKDSEHKARIAHIQQVHDEAMAKLPDHLKERAQKSAKSSASAYLDSLKANHKINAEDVHEVHHTSKGIDKLVGRAVDRKQNPHDIVVKTKSGKIHGASLKATQGTLSNNTTNQFDKEGEKSGVKTNISGIWERGKKKAGLHGLSGKEVKARRDEPKVKEANAETQREAANHHAEVFNKSKLSHQKKHMEYLMKTNPDLHYDYVNGEKGKSTPIEKVDHVKALHSAKSLHATIHNNVVKIHDHEGRHILSVEHRPTHGAFSSIQANAKLGSMKAGK